MDRVTVFAEEAFTFYEGLSADNSKTFWTAHKDVYEKAIREPMRQLLEGLAPAFAADVVIFRPYRDVRFSKDKSPYKTAQGGFLELAPGVGYYLQVDADAVLWEAGSTRTTASRPTGSGPRSTRRRPAPLSKRSPTSWPRRASRSAASRSAPVRAGSRPTIPASISCAAST